MLAKLKISMSLIVNIFATTTVGVIIAGCQQNKPSSDINTKSEQQQYHRPTSIKGEDTVASTPNIVANSGRAKYEPIPLETIKYSLQGRDPADLALNTFEEVESVTITRSCNDGVCGYRRSSPKGTRKVEVTYPKPDRALVVVTQTIPKDNYFKRIKYRVEFTTFGRSLLINSPRAWQIVWAGSQRQCMFEEYHKLQPVSCQQALER
ncbi:MAG: hypothetical protein ACFB02_07465 [Mastigocoleus sp.]